MAGLESETAAGRLWAAGANSGEVRAYDSGTGELLASYPFEAGFLNDLAATPEAIYITDSFVPQLLVIPLAEDGALPEPGQTQVLPISGDLEYGEGFNVNGIVATPAGLVVVHSGSGELFRVDPATGESTRIDTGTATLTAGDGLELDGETLYVVRNQLNQVAVLELDEGVTSASLGRSSPRTTSTCPPRPRCSAMISGRSTRASAWRPRPTPGTGSRASRLRGRTSSSRNAGPSCPLLTGTGR